MQVLGFVISFLPFTISMVGFFAFLFKKGKSYAQLTFMWAVLLLALYFLAEGIYETFSDRYYVFAAVDIMTQFVTPALPVLFIAYVSSLYKNVIDSENLIIYLIPSFMLGIGELFIFANLGMDQTSAYLNAVRNGDVSGFTHPVYLLADFWTMKLIEFVLLVEIIVFFAVLISELARHKVNPLDFFRFFSFGKANNKLDTYDSILMLMLAFIVVYCLRIAVVGWVFTPCTNHLSWVFSLVIGAIMVNCIGLAYLPEVKGVTMRGLVSRDFELTPDPEALVPKAYDSEEYDRMSMNQLALDNDAQLIYLAVVQDKYYLEPNASLKGLSQNIGLSRRRINFVVATLCGCSFGELLEACQNRYGTE